MPVRSKRVADKVCCLSVRSGPRELDSFVTVGLDYRFASSTEGVLSIRRRNKGKPEKASILQPDCPALGNPRDDRVCVLRIGRLLLMDGDGRRRPFGSGGWSHSFGKSTRRERTEARVVRYQRRCDLCDLRALHRPRRHRSTGVLSRPGQGLSLSRALFQCVGYGEIPLRLPASRPSCRNCRTAREVNHSGPCPARAPSG